MNKIIKLAVGLLIARALGRASGWLKNESPLSRGAGAMAKRGEPIRKKADIAGEPLSPAKDAGWL